ncbi:hypothetical protein [Serratia marcescens]|uniref:hypothetical protein n=1 Tax=Serratia marcescens TaxID=615 RepID=UPI00102211A7|nr:hypothetical protein [Serratia marcescens]RZF18795.1 hypothetical protein B7L32_03400 [Serratia marcescens]
MDKLREEFEADFENETGWSAGEYPSQEVVGLCWLLYKQSRASIVIELPDTENYWNGTSGHEIFNHRQFAADSCDALRDIGLSIKGE